jgi:hypothetical protein
MEAHGTICGRLSRRLEYLIAAAMLAATACSQGGGPPADLTRLERQVSLEIAHVRITGPTNAADLKQLGLAQQAQFAGEKAIAAGDYKQAEQDFLRANVLISAINPGVEP